MFRLATKDDLDQIEVIVAEAKKRMAADKLEQWTDEEENYPNRSHFANDIAKGELYVYEAAGKVAGVIAINDDFYDAYPETPDPKRARAYHRVAVSGNFLGQGIGKKLYNEANNTIAKAGYTVAIVDTFTKNQKMCGLIKSCGFEEVGEFELHPQLPNWVLFKKEL